MNLKTYLLGGLALAVLMIALPAASAESGLTDELALDKDALDKDIGDAEPIVIDLPEFGDVKTPPYVCAGYGYNSGTYFSCIGVYAAAPVGSGEICAGSYNSSTGCTGVRKP